MEVKQVDKISSQGVLDNPGSYCYDIPLNVIDIIYEFLVIVAIIDLCRS